MNPIIFFKIRFLKLISQPRVLLILLTKSITNKSFKLIKLHVSIDLEFSNEK